MRGVGLLAATAVALVGVVGGPPAPARAACVPDRAPLTVAATASWDSQALGPERVAAFADGGGVRVAVLDSGVDGGHPQLRGRVLRGRDFLGGAGGGSVDCVGHGTAVAGIIAAAPQPGSAVRGLAPAAEVLPVRVTEQRRVDGAVTGATSAPGRLAAAIRWAVGHGADVLNLSLVLGRDDPAVRAAVAYAVRADVVVVAAAGNAHESGDPMPYPAAYPGVLGVGAIRPDGQRVAASQVGAYVDVVAPGDGVLAAWPGGYATVGGTSFATPFVAATAALVRQRWPALPAAEVARRVVATADPAAGGRAAYGAGVLNPYRAVTEDEPPPRRPAPAVLPDERPDPRAAATARARAGRARQALTVAGVGAGAVGAALLAALVVPRGARRG
ncbi:MAG TPA: type VII secretion-associated serine protease mycosin, partial [Pilimelia sp.]|nr:type VII secretion-associated serine protease mycosin [Pilimelia sp.]